MVICDACRPEVPGAAAPNRVTLVSIPQRRHLRLAVGPVFGSDLVDASPVTSRGRIADRGRSGILEAELRKVELAFANTLHQLDAGQRGRRAPATMDHLWQWGLASWRLALRPYTIDANVRAPLSSTGRISSTI